MLNISYKKCIVMQCEIWKRDAENDAVFVICC